MIRKSFPASTKAIDEDQGIVEAIVNCTAIEDFQKDYMEPGCWDAVIKSAHTGETDWPSLVWGHDWSVTTGKVLAAEELAPGDPRLKSFKSKSGAGGLRIIAAYNLETQRGREAFSDVKFGAVKQWSVGFLTAKDGEHFDNKGVRHVTKVGVWPEVSNVLVGASPGTYTAIAKSAEEVLESEETTMSERAMAIEQTVLHGIEDGVLTEADALEIALVALKTLGDESTPIPEPITKEVAVEEKEPEVSAPEVQAEPAPAPAVFDFNDPATWPEWLAPFLLEEFLKPTQHSDSDNSGDEILTNFGRQNTRTGEQRLGN